MGFKKVSENQRQNSRQSEVGTWLHLVFTVGQQSKKAAVKGDELIDAVAPPTPGGRPIVMYGGHVDPLVFPTREDMLTCIQVRAGHTCLLVSFTGRLHLMCKFQEKIKTIDAFWPIQDRRQFFLCASLPTRSCSRGGNPVPVAFVPSCRPMPVATFMLIFSMQQPI